MGKGIDEMLTSIQLLITLDWDYASDVDPLENVKQTNQNIFFP